MKILFVSSESPIFPAGGIATYLEYMLPSLQKLGHQVFLFTFKESKESEFVQQSDFFTNKNTHIEYFDLEIVKKLYPCKSNYLAMSHYLSPKIERCVNEWGIDIIESTDWQSPCFAIFQKLRNDKNHSNLVCSTFNHALSQTLFEADQKSFGYIETLNHLSERQQVRMSDVVISPSIYNKHKLQQMGLGQNIHVVREPYPFEKTKDIGDGYIDEIQYIGRLSIGKGIDKLIYLSNLINDLRPIKKIELIGKIVETPFSEKSIIAYIKKRLSKVLVERLFYSDFRPRRVISDLYKTGVITPQMGGHETFSYSCVEAIEAGCVPVVSSNSPMAEFFPKDMDEFVIHDSNISGKILSELLQKIINNSKKISVRIQEECENTLNPIKCAESLVQVYELSQNKKIGKTNYFVEKTSISLSDITILVCAHNPNHEFMEMIDSILSQDIGFPKVLICNDGSDERSIPYFDYAESVLPSCKIIHQTNQGLTASRNRLIEECDTDFSFFIDADDLMSSDLLGDLIRFYNNSDSNLDAVLPQRRNFCESNDIYIDNFLNDHLHLIYNDYRMTALIKTKILKKIKFDSFMRNGEADDWEFWLKFTNKGYVAEIFQNAGFFYRFKKGSMSWPWSSGQQVGTQLKIRETLFGML